MRRLPMRGTLLNAGAVALGASIGLVFGGWLPEAWMSVALHGLGLVTMGIGLRMFLRSQNVLYVAGSVAIGGVVGAALGIDAWVASFADWARQTLGAGGRFNEALITTSVLYCVGPMTLLGCIQDAVERKIELLAVKSLMDGVGSVFFAATLGVGVLVTAVVVLLVQGALTLAGRSLGPLANDEPLLAEATATGGALLLAIGLGLTEIKKLPTENYLPALVLAPLAVWAVARIQARRGVDSE